jgi:hypothetical protein
LDCDDTFEVDDTSEWDVEVMKTELCPNGDLQAKQLSEAEC